MGPKRAPFRVVGIDPGLTRMGFGVVEESSGSLRELAAGTLETAPDVATPARLLALFDRLTAVLEHWRPDAVAVERVFFQVNVRTAVPAMQAAGVALLAAARSGADVWEYTPLEVKQAVAGTGRAGKEQVRFMVERLVRAPAPAAPAPGPDTTDALAVAICHVNARRVRALEAAAP